MKKRCFVLAVFCLGFFLYLGFNNVNVVYIGPSFLDGVFRQASSADVEILVKVIDRTVTSIPPVVTPSGGGGSSGGTPSLCTVDTNRAGWSCPDWSSVECSNGRKVRTCRTNCGSFVTDEQDCEVACVSNLQCGEWEGDCDRELTPEMILLGEFLAGEQRACHDLNSCVDDFVDSRQCGDFCEIELREEQVCGEPYLSAYCVDSGEHLFDIDINAWRGTPRRLELVLPFGEQTCSCSVPLTSRWNHVSPGCVEGVSNDDFFGEIDGQYNVVLVWDAERGEYTGWNVRSGRASTLHTTTGLGYFIGKDSDQGERRLEYRR